MNILSDRTNIEQSCDNLKCSLKCNNNFKVSEINRIKEYYNKLDNKARKKFIFFSVSKGKNQAILESDINGAISFIT